MQYFYLQIFIHTFIYKTKQRNKKYTKVTGGGDTFYNWVGRRTEQNRTCRPMTPDKARGLTIHGRAAFKGVYLGGDME